MSLIRVDGALAYSGVTATTRADVNGAYRVTGEHGFDVKVPAKPGRHTVTVAAIGVAGGAVTAQLGSRAVTVAAAAILPIGHVDSVAPMPGGYVRIRGWALDLDQPATSIRVAVYVDGSGISQFPTAIARPDVNRVHRATGLHGFDIKIKVGVGTHKVDVFGINVGSGARNPLIGSATAKVAGTPPIGVLDSAVVKDGSVVLKGWAFDPDQPATAVQVAVYRDGVGIHWFSTGVARPDVNRVHGITGHHGFSISVATAPGRHKFEVVAQNIAPAGPNLLIGSASVVVPA